ncbi:hypothetical protein D3C83_321320 [compost metagenome]
MVLEAQQRNLQHEDADTQSRVSFRGDGMGFQVRKLVRAMLATEAAENRLDQPTGAP